MNIKNIFENLNDVNSSEDNKFATFKPLDNKNHRIGKNHLGEFCLLFKISKTSYYHPSNSFNSFKVHHNLNCIIEENNKKKEYNFSIINLKSSEENIVQRFYDLSSLLLEIIEENVTIENLEKYISDLQNIFADKKIANQSTIVGLIGELAIIDIAEDTNFIVDKWRNKEKDKYDFLNNSNTLEVKATESSKREHNFSFEQLVNPPFNSFVASVLVKSKSPGDKLFDFISDIEKKITNKDLLYKFKKNIFIDIDIEENNFSFDLGYSRNNILFYQTSEVPHIENQPANVTKIKFQSNLSNSKNIDTTIEKILV